ncbi:MAG: hypothetical protein ORN83_16900, partial [Chthoniobacteraceae bacterium]|nr:hypothetical protein [Chthoniobacteraceae bacterium]
KPTGGTKMSRLVNRSELKRYLLDRAQMLRPALGMRRVSDEAVQSLESRLRNMADDLIRRQPCMGRTIKP